MPKKSTKRRMAKTRPKSLKPGRHRHRKKTKGR